MAPPDVTLGDIYRSIWPFVGILLFTMVILMMFPQIALWLPNAYYGN